MEKPSKSHGMMSLPHALIARTTTGWIVIKMVRFAKTNAQTMPSLSIDTKILVSLSKSNVLMCHFYIQNSKD